MRRVVIALAPLIFAVSVTAQTPTVDITKDVDKAKPGSTVTFTVPIRNPTEIGIEAAFRLRLFLATSLASAMHNVLMDHADIRCLRVGIIGTNEVYDCLCVKPTIPMAPGQTITAKAQVVIPGNAIIGSSFTFSATLNYGNSGAVGKSILVTIGANPAPKLAITVIDKERDEDDEALIVSYAFEVANLGDADTTGPVDLDVTYSTPSGTIEHERLINQPWIRSGLAGFHYRHNPILKPGEAFYTTEIALHMTPIRGITTITAVAAGGGSPPAVKQDSTDMAPPRIADSQDKQEPAEVNGRKRD